MSNDFPHGARLSVWANQSAMREEEAKPLVLRDFKQAVRHLPGW